VGEVDSLQHRAFREDLTVTQHILLPQLQSLRVRYTHVSAQALYISTRRTCKGGAYGPSDETCLSMHIVMMSIVNRHCTAGR